MVSRAALIFALSFPKVVWADAATPTAAMRGDRLNLAECAKRFERRFSGFAHDSTFRHGAVTVSPTDDPPQVQYRVTTDDGQSMVAAVLVSGGHPEQAWERDDQWSYPIDPKIAWRERRALPDLEGVVMVYHRPHGVFDWRSKTFVTVAKLAVDDCLAMTRWTAPEGSLTFERRGGMFFERFYFDRSGVTTLGRDTDGGSIGEMGTVSGRDTAPLFTLLRARHLCTLAPTKAQGTEAGALIVDAEGLRCTVRLPLRDGAEEPDAAAIRVSVENLRDRLFPNRAMGSSSR